MKCFSKLDDWMKSKQAVPPSISNLPEFHLWSIAKALKVSPKNRCKQWAQIVETVLASTSNLLQNVLDTDAVATTCDTSIVDIYSTLAESAIESGDGSLAFSTLSCLADRTGLASFRFLSAWTAFNMNEFDACIAECEKVNELFSPIHTLSGQAYLESGRPLEAVDALKVAIELAPSDPLPLVQLIKAYLVSGIQLEAMKVIDRCRQLLGPNIEIESLAAMVILSGPLRKNEFTQKTMSQLAKYLEDDQSNLELFVMGVELATELKLKDWADKYSELILFKISNDAQLISENIGPILKKFGQLGWYDTSRKIIDKVLTVSSDNYQTRQ